MQLNDRLSAEIIKIFHNSKGSIQNDIIKWTNQPSDKHIHEMKNWDSYLEQPSTPHAAGEFEHHLHQKTYTQPEELSNNTIEESTELEAPSTLQKDKNTQHTNSNKKD